MAASWVPTEKKSKWVGIGLVFNYYRKTDKQTNMVRSWILIPAVPLPASRTLDWALHHPERLL